MAQSYRNAAGAIVAKIRRPESYTDIQKEIGIRIKWARELVEPNRAEFARIMGVDRSTLQKIEDGDRPPSIFNVLEFAHRLRVSPNYILDGTLQGVDGEMAALLGESHPELIDRSRTAIRSDTRRLPRKRAG